jgi:hypothetical protein
MVNITGRKSFSEKKKTGRKYKHKHSSIAK